MFSGRIAAIFVAPAAGAPMQACREVVAVTGVGLEGDRYASRTGKFSDAGRGPRDVTLIEREAVDAARADYGIDVTEADTRRNLVTEGVALNHLVGRTFRVGAVTLRGHRLSEPCVYLEQLVGREVVNRAFVHRGGLRAEILEGGEIRVGDAVEGPDT